MQLRDRSVIFFAVTTVLAVLFVVAVQADNEDEGYGYAGEVQGVVQAKGHNGPGNVFLSCKNADVAGDHAKRAYSLYVNPTSGPSGTTLNVTYTADDVTKTWIGIFASGSSSTSHFKYVTAANGSVSLSTSGLAPGAYNVYLVISTGYLMASASYTVTGSSTTTGGSTTGTTTGNTPSGDPTTWLNAHNAKRTQYGMPSLSWSTNLQTSAQNYANTLAGGSPFAPSGGNYGENLAMGYASIAAVLVGWVDKQAPYYDSATKSCRGGVCGGFTQVLWRTTAYVGCGTARSASNTPFYVCHYLRPGNCNGYDYQTTDSPCGPYGP